MDSLSPHCSINNKSEASVCNTGRVNDEQDSLGSETEVMEQLFDKHYLDKPDLQKNEVNEPCCVQKSLTSELSLTKTGLKPVSNHWYKTYTRKKINPANEQKTGEKSNDLDKINTEEKTFVNVNDTQSRVSNNLAPLSSRVKIVFPLNFPLKILDTKGNLITKPPPVLSAERELLKKFPLMLPKPGFGSTSPIRSTTRDNSKTNESNTSIESNLNVKHEKKLTEQDKPKTEKCVNNVQEDITDVISLSAGCRPSSMHVMSCITRDEYQVPYDEEIPDIMSLVTQSRKKERRKQQGKDSILKKTETLSSTIAFVCEKECLSENEKKHPPQLECSKSNTNQKLSDKESATLLLPEKKLPTHKHRDTLFKELNIEQIDKKTEKVLLKQESLESAENVNERQKVKFKNNTIHIEFCELETNKSVIEHMKTEEINNLREKKKREINDIGNGDNGDGNTVKEYTENFRIDTEIVGTKVPVEKRGSKEKNNIELERTPDAQMKTFVSQPINPESKVVKELGKYLEEDLEKSETQNKKQGICTSGDVRFETKPLDRMKVESANSEERKTEIRDLIQNRRFEEKKDIIHKEEQESDQFAENKKVTISFEPESGCNKLDVTSKDFSLNRKITSDSKPVIGQSKRNNSENNTFMKDNSLGREIISDLNPAIRRSKRNSIENNPLMDHENIPGFNTEPSKTNYKSSKKNLNDFNLKITKNELFRKGKWNTLTKELKCKNTELKNEIIQSDLKDKNPMTEGKSIQKEIFETKFINEEREDQESCQTVGLKSPPQKIEREMNFKQVWKNKSQMHPKGIQHPDLVQPTALQRNKKLPRKKEGGTVVKNQSFRQNLPKNVECSPVKLRRSKRKSLEALNECKSFKKIRNMTNMEKDTCCKIKEGKLKNKKDEIFTKEELHNPSRKESKIAKANIAQEEIASLNTQREKKSFENNGEKHALKKNVNQYLLELDMQTQNSKNEHRKKKKSKSKVSETDETLVNSVKNAHGNADSNCKDAHDIKPSVPCEQKVKDSINSFLGTSSKKDNVKQNQILGHKSKHPNETLISKTIESFDHLEKNRDYKMEQNTPSKDFTRKKQHYEENDEQDIRLSRLKTGEFQCQDTEIKLNRQTKNNEESRIDKIEQSIQKCLPIFFNNDDEIKIHKAAKINESRNSKVEELELCINTDRREPEFSAEEMKPFEKPDILNRDLGIESNSTDETVESIDAIQKFMNDFKSPEAKTPINSILSYKTEILTILENSNSTKSLVEVEPGETKKSEHHYSLLSHESRSVQYQKNTASTTSKVEQFLGHAENSIALKKERSPKPVIKNDLTLRSKSHAVQSEGFHQHQVDFFSPKLELHNFPPKLCVNISTLDHGEERVETGSIGNVREEQQLTVSLLSETGSSGKLSENQTNKETSVTSRGNFRKNSTEVIHENPTSPVDVQDRFETTPKVTTEISFSLLGTKFRDCSSKNITENKNDSEIVMPINDEETCNFNTVIDLHNPTKNVPNTETGFLPEIISNTEVGSKIEIIPHCERQKPRIRSEANFIFVGIVEEKSIPNNNANSEITEFTPDSVKKTKAIIDDVSKAEVTAEFKNSLTIKKSDSCFSSTNNASQDKTISSNTIDITVSDVIDTPTNVTSSSDASEIIEGIKAPLHNNINVTKNTTKKIVPKALTTDNVTKDKNLELTSIDSEINIDSRYNREIIVVSTTESNSETCSSTTRNIPVPSVSSKTRDPKSMGFSETSRSEMENGPVMQTKITSLILDVPLNVTANNIISKYSPTSQNILDDNIGSKSTNVPEGSTINSVSKTLDTKNAKEIEVFITNESISSPKCDTETNIFVETEIISKNLNLTSFDSEINVDLGLSTEKNNLPITKNESKCANETISSPKDLAETDSILGTTIISQNLELTSVDSERNSNVAITTETNAVGTTENKYVNTTETNSTSKGDREIIPENLELDTSYPEMDIDVVINTETDSLSITESNSENTYEIISNPEDSIEIISEKLELKSIDSENNTAVINTERNSLPTTASNSENTNEAISHPKDDGDIIPEMLELKSIDPKMKIDDVVNMVTTENDGVTIVSAETFITPASIIPSIDLQIRRFEKNNVTEPSIDCLVKPISNPEDVTETDIMVKMDNIPKNMEITEYYPEKTNETINGPKNITKSNNIEETKIVSQNLLSRNVDSQINIYPVTNTETSSLSVSENNSDDGNKTIGNPKIDTKTNIIIETNFINDNFELTPKINIEPNIKSEPSVISDTRSISVFKNSGTPDNVVETNNSYEIIEDAKVSVESAIIIENVMTTCDAGSLKNTDSIVETVNVYSLTGGNVKTEIGKEANTSLELENITSLKNTDSIVQTVNFDNLTGANVNTEIGKEANTSLELENITSSDSSASKINPELPQKTERIIGAGSSQTVVPGNISKSAVIQDVIDFEATHSEPSMSDVNAKGTNIIPVDGIINNLLTKYGIQSCFVNLDKILIEGNSFSGEELKTLIENYNLISGKSKTNEELNQPYIKQEVPDVECEFNGKYQQNTHIDRKYTFTRHRKRGSDFFTVTQLRNKQVVKYLNYKSESSDDDDNYSVCSDGTLSQQSESEIDSSNENQSDSNNDDISDMKKVRVRLEKIDHMLSESNTIKLDAAILQKLDCNINPKQLLNSGIQLLEQPYNNNSDSLLPTKTLNHDNQEIKKVNLPKLVVRKLCPKSKKSVTKMSGPSIVPPRKLQVNTPHIVNTAAEFEEKAKAMNKELEMLLKPNLNGLNPLKAKKKLCPKSKMHTFDLLREDKNTRKVADDDIEIIFDSRESIFSARTDCSENSSTVIKYKLEILDSDNFRNIIQNTPLNSSTNTKKVRISPLNRNTNNEIITSSNRTTNTQKVIITALNKNTKNTKKDVIAPPNSTTNTEKARISSLNRNTNNTNKETTTLSHSNANGEVTSPLNSSSTKKVCLPPFKRNFNIPMSRVEVKDEVSPWILKEEKSPTKYDDEKDAIEQSLPSKSSVLMKNENTSKETIMKPKVTKASEGAWNKKPADFAKEFLKYVQSSSEPTQSKKILKNPKITTKKTTSTFKSNENAAKIAALIIKNPSTVNSNAEVTHSTVISKAEQPGPKRKVFRNAKIFTLTKAVKNNSISKNRSDLPSKSSITNVCEKNTLITTKVTVEYINSVEKAFNINDDSSDELCSGRKETSLEMPNLESCSKPTTTNPDKIKTGVPSNVVNSTVNNSQDSAIPKHLPQNGKVKQDSPQNLTKDKVHHDKDDVETPNLESCSKPTTTNPDNIITDVPSNVVNSTVNNSQALAIPKHLPQNGKVKQNSPQNLTKDKVHHDKDGVENKSLNEYALQYENIFSSPLKSASSLQSLCSSLDPMMQLDINDPILPGSFTYEETVLEDLFPDSVLDYDPQLFQNNSLNCQVISHEVSNVESQSNCFVPISCLDSRNFSSTPATNINVIDNSPYKPDLPKLNAPIQCTSSVPISNSESSCFDSISQNNINVTANSTCNPDAMVKNSFSNVLEQRTSNIEMQANSRDSISRTGVFVSPPQNIVLPIKPGNNTSKETPFKCNQTDEHVGNTSAQPIKNVCQDNVKPEPKRQNVTRMLRAVRPLKTASNKSHFKDGISNNKTQDEASTNEPKIPSLKHDISFDSNPDIFKPHLVVGPCTSADTCNSVRPIAPASNVSTAQGELSISSLNNVSEVDFSNYLDPIHSQSLNSTFATEAPLSTPPASNVNIASDTSNVLISPFVSTEQCMNNNDIIDRNNFHISESTSAPSKTLSVNYETSTFNDMLLPSSGDTSKTEYPKTPANISPLKGHGFDCRELDDTLLSVLDSFDKFCSESVKTEDLDSFSTKQITLTSPRKVQKRKSPQKRKPVASVDSYITVIDSVVSHYSDVSAVNPELPNDKNKYPCSTVDSYVSAIDSVVSNYSDCKMESDAYSNNESFTKTNRMQLNFLPPIQSLKSNLPVFEVPNSTCMSSVNSITTSEILIGPDTFDNHVISSNISVGNNSNQNMVSTNFSSCSNAIKPEENSWNQVTDSFKSENASLIDGEAKFQALADWIIEDYLEIPKDSLENVVLSTCATAASSIETISSQLEASCEENSKNFPLNMPSTSAQSSIYITQDAMTSPSSRQSVKNESPQHLNISDETARINRVYGCLDMKAKQNLAWNQTGLLKVNKTELRQFRRSSQLDMKADAAFPKVSTSVQAEERTKLSSESSSSTHQPSMQKLKRKSREKNTDVSKKIKVELNSNTELKMSSNTDESMADVRELSGPNHTTTVEEVTPSITPTFAADSTKCLELTGSANEKCPLPTQMENMKCDTSVERHHNNSIEISANINNCQKDIQQPCISKITSKPHLTLSLVPCKPVVVPKISVNSAQSIARKNILEIRPLKRKSDKCDVESPPRVEGKKHDMNSIMKQQLETVKRFCLGKNTKKQTPGVPEVEIKNRVFKTGDFCIKNQELFHLCPRLWKINIEKQNITEFSYIRVNDEANGQYSFIFQEKNCIGNFQSEDTNLWIKIYFCVEPSGILFDQVKNEQVLEKFLLQRSYSASERFRSTFNIYIQVIISQAMNSDFIPFILQSSKENYYFSQPWLDINGVLKRYMTTMNRCFFLYDEHIVDALLLYSSCTLEKGDQSAVQDNYTCPLCGTGVCQVKMILKGPFYDRKNLHSLDNEDDKKETYLCNECAQCCVLFSKVVHFNYLVYQLALKHVKKQFPEAFPHENITISAVGTSDQHKEAHKTAAKEKPLKESILSDSGFYSKLFSYFQSVLSYIDYCDYFILSGPYIFRRKLKRRPDDFTVHVEYEKPASAEGKQNDASTDGKKSV